MVEVKDNLDKDIKTSIKQAIEIAESTIESLRGSISSGYMTHIELVQILAGGLKRTIEDLRYFRPGNLPVLDLEELGLNNLLKELERLEKRH